MSKYAIFWFVLGLIISCTNDILSKFLGSDLHPTQVIFWRFFFSILTIIPIALTKGIRILQTHSLKIHVIRGGVLAIAIFLWNYGIQMVPIATVTVMSFSVPIFTLALAPIMLREAVNWQLWLVTLIGFSGVITIFTPTIHDFNLASLLFIVASILFAYLDIINRKLLISGEKSITMIIYSALFSIAFSLYPAINYWQTPNMLQLTLLAILGLGSNFILYCLLRAFQYANASSLAPLRYLELLLSLLAGYFIFHETPPFHTYIGASIIIISSFIVTQFGSLSYAKK